MFTAKHRKLPSWAEESLTQKRWDHRPAGRSDRNRKEITPAKPSCQLVFLPLSLSFVLTHSRYPCSSKEENQDVRPNASQSNIPIEQTGNSEETVARLLEFAANPHCFATNIK